MPAAHCLVYENADEGVTAARAAGMYVVDVRHLPTTPEGGPDSDAKGEKLLDWQVGSA
ncbi:hypothetical protein [Streptomyces sp. NPDC101206]|uniref:hypothetical protein n=1 Tax=Streptomyces sp. NPDC101206 TaxID=3366128 RepID=UPI003806F00A